mmetsp:Transcript_5831/g.18388  ORF Transcript_5831/g.18388 Transcript_5831/m.18388 type:complete len:869 (+) Transcript_5831:135-2741(+)
MDRALSLEWTFGLSRVANSVISLSDGSRNALFYAAAQTGIFYDYSVRLQRLLQGHCNAISCAVLTQDKKWLVTADAGIDSLVIVWDSTTGNPVRVIASPQGGVLTVDVSPDATLVALLSEVILPEIARQELVIWDWQNPQNMPAFTANIASPHKQTCVRFNDSNLDELVTNGASTVYFWSCQEAMSCHAPLGSRDNGRNANYTYTVSSFLPHTAQAITATLDGYLILWDVAFGDKEDINVKRKVNERTATKVIRLCEGAINCLATYDMYIIAAGNDGAVRIYDLLFRLEAWFEDLDAGPVTSISLSRPSSSLKAPQGKLPNLVVGTESSTIIYLSANTFQAVQPEDRRGLVLVQGMADEVRSVSLHPTQPLLLIACSGGLYLWDYILKTLRSVRLLNSSKLQPHCISFDHIGRSLVVGSTTGVLKMLDSTSLADAGALLKSGDTKIMLLEFSLDSQWLAAADASFSVALWRRAEVTDDTHESSPGLAYDWTYIGHYNAHSRPVRGLQFGYRDGNVALFSVSEDRTLVEYSLLASTVATGVSISGVFNLEEAAVPTACLWHPATTEDFEDRMITANSELKLRQWNVDNKLCRRTSLGPMFGGALVRLASLAAADARTDLLAYAAKSGVAGILKLPLDGNPNKSVGVVAHPEALCALAATTSSSQIFTAGGCDQTVSLWCVQKNLVDAFEVTGGSQMEPYLALLSLDNENETYEKLVDYFYYLQLRNEDTDRTSSSRPGTIPLSDVARLMRAVGYFPSDQDIVNLVSEVKYSTFSHSGKITERVDLLAFIKLLVNHRPISGIKVDQIRRALDFIRLVPSDGLISWRELRNVLETRGEVFSTLELSASLHALGWDSSARTVAVREFETRLS